MGDQHRTTGGKAEQALRESEERFREFVEGTNDLATQVDATGNFTYVNHASERILGLPPEQCVGLSAFSFVHPDDRDRTERWFRDSQQNHIANASIENRQVSRNGDVHDMQWTSNFHCDPDGNPTVANGIARDITARKRAEEALRKSEQEYRALFTQMIDAYALHEIILDDNGKPVDYRFLAVNPAFERLTGLQADDIIGKTVLAVLPETEPYWIETYGHVALTGEPAHFENTSEELGRHYEVTAYRPAPGQFACTFVDITGRKRAEDALRDSETWASTMFRESPSVIEVYDLDGLQIDVNRAYEELWGFPASHTVNKFNVLKSKEVAETGLIEYVRRAYAGETVTVPEYQFDSTGETEGKGRGRPRWLSTRLYPLKNAAGDVTNIVINHEDVSDRVLADEELVHQSSLRQLLLDAMPCVAILLKPETREIIACNETAIKAGCVIGETCFGTWPKADEPCWFCRAPKLWESGEAQHLEIDTLGVVWDAHWIPVGDGTYLHYAFDITEQRRTEQQLRHAQKMEAIGQLAGGIAHDFNNILAAIQGNADLIRLDMGLDSQHVARAEEIVKASQRATELTRQLLTFARKAEIQRADVDVHAVIREVTKLLSHSLDRRIEISVDLRAKLATVTGDEGQLQNALLNLGINARDAMPEGGTLKFATRDIQIDEQEAQDLFYGAAGRYIEINITDTGIGMAPETQDKIFEPFFTTKEVGKGTGLGLAAVYGCVKSHNGAISVDSKLGEGATFRILLPLSAEPAQTAGQRATSASIVTGEGHILIIDDEDAVRQLAATILEHLGYTVTECSDGIAAIEYFTDNHDQVDLVILDLVMPIMSGEEVFDALKQIDPDVKVLVSSGYSESKSASVLAKGATAVLGKPYRVATLSQAIQRAINQK